MSPASSDDAPQVISREQVEHVALLSRLELSAAEIDHFSRDLNRILGFFQTLDALDTSDVPPTSHPAPLTNVLRPDEPRPSLTVDEALANAPDAEADCFKVPQIIQES